MTSSPISAHLRSRWFPSRWLLIAAVLFILMVSVITYAVMRKTEQNNVETITRKVGNHLLLPSNETPALLTITDRSKVNTPFLRQAMNGDRILIYQVNKKAIIYRPSIDKVVDVGPVIIDEIPVNTKD